MTVRGKIVYDQRLAALNHVATLEAAGLSLKMACEEAGVSVTNIERWRRSYREHGLRGLIGGVGTGRPELAACLSDEAIARIRELVLRTDSVALAYDLFLDDPLCPPEVRATLMDGRGRQRIPLSLRRIAYITPEIKAMHRGPKNYQLNSFSVRRDMTEIMPDGTRRDIQPGDWWELDDMSLNHPFRYDLDCPECGANAHRTGEYVAPKSSRCSKLAHRWGCEVGRQSLWALDVASCKWLGFEFVGRPRDAYRGEDILRFLRKLFETYGLPRRGLRLERGVWMSRRITGYEQKQELRHDPEYDDLINGYELPAMPETEQKVVVGGLAQLGIEVAYCYSPHHKGMIESSFDHLQSIANAMVGDR